MSSQDAPIPSWGGGKRRWRPRTRRSLFVASLKLLLPTVAAGLIVLLVVWSQMNLDENRFRLGVSELAPEEIDSLNVVNARYEGIDEKNRPFSVTAAVATQVDREADVIDLEQPKADITLENGSWIALSAERGRYGRNEEMLDLAGSVSLFHDKGFEVHVETVRVDLKDSTAISHDAVDGQGPAGHLTSQGLEIQDGGKRILFTGRSKLILNGAESGTESGAEAGMGDVSQ